MKAKGSFLHFDRARPHLTADEFDKFGIKRLVQPSYRPDLAARNFSLFDSPKHCLGASPSMTTWRRQICESFH
jgi:hypothetical protein